MKKITKKQKEHDKKKNLCYECKKRKIANSCGMCKRCFERGLKRIERLREKIKKDRAKKKDKKCGYCKKEITTKKDLKAYIEDGYCKPCGIKMAKWAKDLFGPK